MRSFTKLYSDFWITPDNAELMELGVDAKLVAIYLQGNPHHNMLGVYYLPLLYVASDLKLPVKKIQRAFKQLSDISYCKYDEKTQYIWVCNLALKQLGEEIAVKDNRDSKDNRIKAIQAIWNSLPIQIEFLPAVYAKYGDIFDLKPHLINFSADKTKNNAAAKNLLDTPEPIRNVNIPTDHINLNLEKKSLLDSNQNSSAFSTATIDHSLNLSSPLAETTNNPAPLQIPPAGENDCNFNNSNISISLVESCGTTQIVQKDHLLVADTITSTQNLVGEAANKNIEITLSHLQGVTNFSGTPAKELPSPFEIPLKDLSTPFKAPAKGLRSPSEAPVEPLRSNIEYRIKNIENRRKKLEKELEIEKNKKDLNLDRVLIPNIVAPARSSLELKTQNFSATEGLFFANYESYLTPALEPQLALVAEPKQEPKPKLATRAGSQQQTLPQVLGALPSKPNPPTRLTAESEQSELCSGFELSSESQLELPTKLLAEPLVQPILTLNSKPNVDLALKPASKSIQAFIYEAEEINTKSNLAAAIVTVFSHWQITMQHPRANLDRKRKFLISQALQLGYTVQELREAITGCAQTPHNLGKNQQGQRYDGLYIILRDADQIDRFIHNCHHPPVPYTEAQYRLQANTKEAESWAKDKLQSLTNQQA